MIERIIELSIRNRFLVLILAAALTVAGIYATLNTPVDAIPDLSENQVIVFTDWMGRSPREIEDQITYPLSRKLQGLAGVKAVRSSSEFNFSMITIIFDDNIDFYFARQRVTEKLSQANTFLPPGVVPYLAPDATALGQIFWYTVEDSPEQSDRFRPLVGTQQVLHRAATECGRRAWPTWRSSAARRWNIRSTCGRKICGPTASRWASCMRRSARATCRPAAAWCRRTTPSTSSAASAGSKTSRTSKTRSSRRSKARRSTFTTSPRCSFGTQFRRSVFEKDGNEVTGGVVLMRHGENPLTVTERVKEKIQELQPGLPAGVHIVPAYDRTRLIHGAIHTLTEVMWHEMLIASIAILLILMHFRSVFVICVTLPLAVLFSFLMMWVLRTTGHHRHPGQHHVAGRHHDLDRHPGRSGDRDDRERHAST